MTCIFYTLWSQIICQKRPVQLSGSCLNILTRERDLRGILCSVSVHTGATAIGVSSVHTGPTSTGFIPLFSICWLWLFLIQVCPLHEAYKPGENFGLYRGNACVVAAFAFDVFQEWFAVPLFSVDTGLTGTWVGLCSLLTQDLQVHGLTSVLCLHRTYRYRGWPLFPVDTGPIASIGTERVIYFLFF